MVENAKVNITIVSVLKNYKIKFFRYDAIAGITVAAIAIPQAMAYSQLAGAPITMGLYATFIAMILYAVFTSTKQVIVGPDAAVAALTAATLLPLANNNPAHYAALVAILALLIGVASLVAVATKLSFLGDFLSRPILLGYMAGLALAVIASQAPKLLGLPGLVGGSFFSNVFYSLTNLFNANGATLLLSIVLGGASIILRKFTPKIPASLVVLAFSILLSWFFDFQNNGISVIGAIPSGLPIPSLPKVSFFDIQQLVIPAFAIMMVSYANTITTARSFAAKRKDQVDSAQELTSLGIAGIGTGLFGGIPIAASGVRTAVNEESKAISQVSQIIGAVMVGFALLFLTPVLQYLPQAALAVIIIMAVIKLFNLDELRSIWHAWRSEAALAIITVAGVALLGIFQGLLLAILLAIVNLIRTSAFPTDAVLGIAEDGSIRDKSRPPKTEPKQGIIMYRFDAPLHFGNANYFRQRLFI